MQKSGNGWTEVSTADKSRVEIKNILDNDLQKYEIKISELLANEIIEVRPILNMDVEFLEKGSKAVTGGTEHYYGFEREDRLILYDVVRDSQNKY